MMQLSAEARNLNWLVSNFVERVPGVNEATVVSSDGLLIALSDGLDRSSGDRLAAVSAGLLSIAKGGSTPIGGGRVHEVIVEMDMAMLFVMRVSDTSVLAATTARPCDVGLVGYEMAVLVEKCASALTPGLISELQTAPAEVGDPMNGSTGPRDPGEAVRHRTLVRPYMLTRGRTSSSLGVFALHAPVLALIAPEQLGRNATPEDRRIIELCQTPMSVAELSARMTAPVGVVRVLVGDLVVARMVHVRQTEDRRRAPRRAAARTAAGGYPCDLSSTLR